MTLSGPSQRLIQDVAREIISQFPNVSRVATTLRESLSASHNNCEARGSQGCSRMLGGLPRTRLR